MLCLIGKDYFCFMDRNARVRLLHEARTKAVALRHTAFLYLDVVQTSHVSQREVLPLLWVDAEQRPEIVDLWRVHAAEGCGDVVTRWVGDFFAPIPALFLLCSLTTPVCVTFSLAFPLPQQEEVLLLLASCHRVALLNRRPPRWFTAQTSAQDVEYTLPQVTELLAHGFTLDTFHPELVHMVAQWKRSRISSLR